MNDELRKLAQIFVYIAVTFLLIFFITQAVIYIVNDISSENHIISNKPIKPILEITIKDSLIDTIYIYRKPK